MQGTIAKEQLAYLTTDLPGIGGAIKHRPEDFLVEEQPLYEPTGSGEHLLMCIQKQLRSTSDVVRHLSSVFHVSKREIGYAGLKDKHAVSTQHFTVRLPDPGRDSELLDQFNHTHYKLLWAQRHLNKLKRGHLAGNRFVIKIREVDPMAAVDVRRVVDRLVAHGVPNYVGYQRFGYRAVNHKIGRLLLLGKWQEMLDLMLGHPHESDHLPTRAAREAYLKKDYAAALAQLPRHLHHDRQALDALRQGKTPQDAVMTISTQQRTFFISALQSAVFNRVLHHRLTDPSSPGIDRLTEGDLAWKHDKRAVFAVDHATAELENQPDQRVKRLEVSPSGPMWGAGMLKADGVVGQWEEQALIQEGLAESDLQGGPHAKAPGDRRPMRVVMKNPDVSGGVDEHGPYIRLAFDLPRGSFATTVLREITKNTLNHTQNYHAPSPQAPAAD